MVRLIDVAPPGPWPCGWATWEYMGDNECDPYMKRLLAPLGVECVDARKLEREHSCRILCGWELKPYAALHSPFAEVLFLDADNGVVRDPTYLFDEPESLRTGAVFWPDYASSTHTSDIWQIFGMDHMAERAEHERAFESGQLLRINSAIAAEAGQCL